MKFDNRGRKYTIDFSNDGSLVIEFVNGQKEIKIPESVVENLAAFLAKHFKYDQGSKLISDLEDLVYKYS